MCNSCQSNAMGDKHRLRDRLRATEDGSPACLNCGAPLAGAFCAACGQRDVPPYPSVRELAAEAISEFSGWDGRLASSVRALILRPGLLTHEFLEGRRARYISPLRLYLTASLIYFVLAAAAPNVKLESGRSLFLGVQVGATTTDSNRPQSRPERVANAGSVGVGSRRAEVHVLPILTRSGLSTAFLSPSSTIVQFFVYSWRFSGVSGSASF